MCASVLATGWGKRGCSYPAVDRWFPRMLFLGPQGPHLKTDRRRTRQERFKPVPTTQRAPQGTFWHFPVSLLASETQFNRR